MRKYIILLISIVLFHCTLNTDSIKIKPKLIFYEREDDPKYSLSEPSVLFLDNDANFYLLTLCDGTIKKYNKDGMFLMQICKRGPGPGELSYPPGANIINNRLYIIDSNLRKHILDINGKLIKSELVPSVKYDDGKLYTDWAKSINDFTWVASGGFRKWKNQNDQGWTALMLFTKNGYKREKIYSFNRPQMNVPKKRHCITKYIPDIRWDIFSNGDIVYCRMDEYKIYRYSHGKTKLIISEDFHPIEIDNNIKRWASERFRKDQKGFVPLAKYRNIINLVAADNNGYLWVLTNSKEFKGLKLYTNEGKYVRSYILDSLLSSIEAEKLYFCVAANYLFFSIYDDLEGQKIYRSAIKVK